MSALLAIDPGLSTCGWAYFEGRELKACGLSRTKAKSISQRAAEHRANLEHFYPGVRVVCERMSVRGAFSKVDAQDLVDVNLISGHLGTTEWCLPSEWKGDVPKDVHHRRIESVLAEHELCLLKGVLPASLRHNAYDAVGLGLFATQRLTSRGR